jgi:hypothetical protein
MEFIVKISGRHFVGGESVSAMMMAPSKQGCAGAFAGMARSD